VADEATVRALLSGRGEWDEFRAQSMLRQRSTAGTFRPDLRGVDLHGADLERRDLRDALLSNADLRSAKLAHADLSEADLTGAKLSGANLLFARLKDACLAGANLTDANLACTTLVRTDLTRAKLVGCRVYGAAVWDVNVADALQTDLVASPLGQPRLVTDSLEVAQFLYLLLKNAKLRDVLDTIGTKAVLILGRFSATEKPVLDSLRATLRKRGWVPIMFDFEPSENRDLTETVSTIAHLSRFVIADLTNPRSIPQELTRIVPNLPSVAVQPIIRAPQDPYAMFGDLLRYPWVLKPYRYRSNESLLADLEKRVVGPAEAKAEKLTKGRKHPVRRSRSSSSDNV
jgi:uncharacterized protein YjbI with pentapeptide repeats